MPDVSQTLGDERLAVQARDGDMGAFDALARRYAGRVYLIALGRLGNREAAEDLTQEVFLRVYLRLDQFDATRKFSHWISRIAHNLACDWQRSRRTFSGLTMMVSLDETTTEVPDSQAENAWEALEAQERRVALDQAVFGLPEDARELVLLKFIEGLSNKQIADHLGVHPATIGRQLKKAQRMLKAHLAPLVRDGTDAFGAPRKLAVRTMTIIGAVSLMTVEARSELAAAAGDLEALSAEVTLGTSGGGAAKIAAGLLPALWQPVGTLIALPLKLLSLGKPVAWGLIGLAAVGGVIYVIHESDLIWPPSLSTSGSDAGGGTRSDLDQAEIDGRAARPRQRSQPPPPPPLFTPEPTLPPRFTPGPTPTPAVRPPARAPAANRRALLEQAARAAGVRLVEFRPRGNGAMVGVSWSGGRADRGSDFLEQARRNGAIRDFNPAPNLSSRIVGGRRVYTARFSVSF